jgi:hypothetical protein
MQYHVDKCLPEKGETYKLAKEFGQQLIDNCKEALKENPVYKDGESCRHLAFTFRLTSSSTQLLSPLLRPLLSAARETSSTRK